MSTHKVNLLWRAIVFIIPVWTSLTKQFTLINKHFCILFDIRSMEWENFLIKVNGLSTIVRGELVNAVTCSISATITTRKYAQQWNSIMAFCNNGLNNSGLQFCMTELVRSHQTWIVTRRLPWRVRNCPSGGSTVAELTVRLQTFPRVLYVLLSSFVTRKFFNGRLPPALKKIGPLFRSQIILV